MKTYYVYITTNPNRTVLYTGMTNNLTQRLIQHHESRGSQSKFAGKFYCYNLLYFEEYQEVWDAIRREKQLKGWRREKKEQLIQKMNPEWAFLNHLFL